LELSLIRFFLVVKSMDLLDRLLGHDAWTTRLLLARCEGLSDVELDCEFDIGHRSVRRTLLHIIRNVEVWSDLMGQRPVRADAGSRADGRSVAGMSARLDRAADDLATLARSVAVRGAWDATWVDYLDRPPQEKTFGSGIAHLITHSMHHRAQLLYLLRRLGVADLPEGDVFSWELGRGGERESGRTRG
jgi:uncharacterized damage-inducible protein DinB